MTSGREAEKAGEQGRQRTVRLDAEFYPRQWLEKASQSFSHLADITISTEGNTQLVKFESRKSEMDDELCDEFVNFVLASMVSEQ